MDGELRELIELIRGGDSNAFGSLYRQYKKYVYKLLLGLRSPEDREDISQQVFENLWKSIATSKSFRFLSDAQFRGFIRVTTLNCLRNHIKQNKKLPPMLTLDEALETISLDSPNPHRQLEWNEKLLKIVKDLGPDESDILTLKLYDLSHRDIAYILGISPGASRTRLTRLLKKLQTWQPRTCNNLSRSDVK